MEKNDKRVKLACYATNITMSVIGNLSPLLFLTFRSLYDISYSLLGLLILINFCTQLCVDLIFSFFSHKFNIALTVKLTPVIAFVGLGFYALSPILFSQNIYLGLVLSTIVFSAASGLAEVLISPVIAALPSENPEREMSKLHSVYAWGVVFVILVGTLFLLFCGGTNWQWLAAIFMLVPMLAACLFFTAKLPVLETPERVSGALALLKNKKLWLCFFGIFLGGASECTMGQWSSSYLEQALGLEKVWGDIFGVAMFAVALGLGRTLYGKFGKNIEKVLFLGGLGAAVCYLVAAISNIPLLGLIACALTGFCVSMLWPGSLIVASERVPQGGVFVYAMMAAGGDLGASVAPQLVGIVTDAVSQNAAAAEFAVELGITSEQLGMKTGMLLGAVFPIIAVFVYLVLMKTKKKSLPLEK